MILDERNEFFDNEDITGATGTALVGDVIDLERADNIGFGDYAMLVVSIDTEVDSTGDAATVQFILASDSTAAIATDGSATEHFTSRAFTETELAAGEIVVRARMPQGSDYEQFLGILVVTAGETTTAGNASAYLVSDASGWAAYPDSANIS